ncbi:MAG: DNA replication/repair protein RecF [Clostridia bacterium]|nr:DNA replication/repair protein RecF [Clostridia bacterium]
MFVSKIELQNFRNYETLSAELGSGVNVFYGNNGQGKTNILESVFLCAIGRSFRFSKDADLVMNGRDNYSVSLSVGDDITNDISIKYRTGQQGLPAGGEKSARVNGLYLRRLGHLMGNLLSVIFSPEDLEIVNDGPSVRRKLLDIVISQIYPSHYFDLQQYNKIISQKNVLLRDFSTEKSGLSELLDVYNEQLSAAGSRISARRLLFSRELEEYASLKNSEISAGEQLSFQYYSNFFTVSALETDNFEDYSKKIQSEFDEILSSRKTREIERAHALYGPQNDDLLISLSGMDLRRFGSQGQKRTAVLSIKLAETLLLYKHTGRKPVLLLDDVFSELDETRCSLLLGSTEGFQTLLTTANLSELPRKVRDNAKIFFVKSGTLKLI